MHLSISHGYKLGVGQEAIEADYKGVGHGDLHNVRGDFSRIGLDDFPRTVKRLFNREVLLRDINIRFQEAEPTFGSTPLQVEYSLVTYKGKEHTVKGLGRKYL